MPTFSRWLPDGPTAPSPRSVRNLILASLPIPAIAWLLGGAPGLFITTEFAVGIGLLLLKDELRLRRLAKHRVADSICTFARQFPRGAPDPYILRAVYEGIQPFTHYSGGTLPIHGTDRLLEDLGMDRETVEELAEEVAVRAGRSLEDPEQNPLYGKVLTVGDLAYFLSYQEPKSAA